ncbi:hypothetical protein [Actinomadura algeriensis]|uniref:Uncharacterized protein n=1 Tax=Actinomadura algeriensis TaxID=1679523 RepID=A0ABR9JS36_9ACTN|nr:hypothetical protein [Actinomadura algeriensis]MBE1533361.1 hypothetical protein [Actinomadura algeriensis]
MRYIAEINFNHSAEFDEVSFDEFITAVERYRARWKLGEGTVKVLYETMYGIEENRRDQGRWRLSPDEKALLTSLSKRTHPMFEEYLREQGLTGTPQPNPAPLRIARLFDSLDASGAPHVQRPPVPIEDREPLLRYLEQAPIVLAARGQDTDIIDPAHPERVPLSYHTDGTWIWPGATAYYLRNHNIPPEPGLVGHARGSLYAIPDVDEDTRAEAVTAVNERA